jgi:hypothetical protein
MIDYHAKLVSALNTVLPTCYEMALTSKTQTPCISYMEINNYSTSTGDTLGYSRITYQVKVWADNIGVIQNYALEIDKVLRPLGFMRISSGELYDNNSSMIQKIMTYEALALEDYDGGIL